MRKAILFLGIAFLFIGCKKGNEAKVPKKLIDKTVMVNVYYDLALLEASKYQMMSKMEYQKMTPKEFILKKYKIDSTQFSQSNIYYATSIEEYKAMFEQVENRLQTNSDKIDTIIKRKQKPLKQGKTEKNSSGRMEKLAQ